MRQPVIKYNEFDFEENIYGPYTFLKYKETFFTGTLLDDDGKSYTEYENGNANGRSISYYENGQLESDYLFMNGDYTSGKEWYPNGQLKYDSEQAIYWDIDGIIALQNSSWRYKNGNKITGDDDEGNHLTFASNGEIAIKIERYKEGSYDRKKFYYDKVLSVYYPEMLINLYPNLDPNFINSTYSIFGWIGQVYVEDNERGKQLLKSLFEHPNKHAAKFAKELHKFTIQKKNGNTETSSWLEQSKNSIIVN